MIKLDNSLTRWRGSAMLFAMMIGLLVTSCGVDDFTTPPPSGVAPSIANLTLLNSDLATPAQGDTVAFDLDFGITADFADNSSSLTFARLTILDTNQLAVLDTVLELVGNSETLLFRVPALTTNIGPHTLVVSAVDSENLTSESQLPFFSKGILQNQTQMFVLGSLNGWGGTDNQMTLVDDYTWETPVAVNDTDEFKFANTSDFSDTDWSDDNCDGVASPTDANNINCLPGAGAFMLTFNDQTLAWGFRELTSANAAMYMRGSFNGWGTDQMFLIEDDTWQVKNVTFAGDDGFKFANTDDWSDLDWGDDECDNVASNGAGDAFCVPADGTFTVTFNDATGAYSFE